MSRNCTDFACLEEQKAEELLKLSAAVEERDEISFSWAPVVDGEWLKAPPTDLIEAKNYNIDVPIIIGSNRDEIGGFLSSEKMFEEKDFNELVIYDDFNSDGYHVRQNETDLTFIKSLYSVSGNYEYPADLGDFSNWWWMAQRVETDR